MSNSHVIRIPQNSINFRRPNTKKGIKLGFCRVCTCFNLEFMSSKSALLKVFEIIMGSCCEMLLIRFGMSAACDIGEAFFSFHSTVTACLSTTLILMVCYFLSAKTYNLMQQTIFELVFNLFACGTYASASTFIGFASNFSLYPRFLSTSSDAAFPAIVSVYYLGAILSICYGMDAWISYKIFKST
ncbi:hypothetical protein PVAND_005019 [Polypedilum vanderplanki]|uniref:MARVEL domain-containing protein n=1 Tax=Polypedilum vanderplanki TaxID=319348 RepID=A0A9J6BZ14_POLVA|nr:hypothetical protein PVAND_005019 [Polypedilum vanderplanki]